MFLWNVENAMKMSPEPFEAMLPFRPRPRLARFAMPLSWGGSPDAALELVAPHSRAAPDVSLGHRTAGGVLDGGKDVLGLHVKAVDVVEAAHPRLCAGRKAP